MIVEADVLNAEDVLAVQRGLATAPFRDGRLTAGPVAQKIKDNEQARGNDPEVIALARRVRIALEGHRVVRTWARPTRWSGLMFSRYRMGQRYGLHTDDAVMFDDGGWPLRTDISFTLFRSDPDSYEGGALIIRDSAGERHFRPKAGSAVFYSTGQLHGVAPVTHGERLVCVGWIQSRVRRSDQREILFELEQVRTGMRVGESSLILDKTIGNLIRMWGGD